MTTRTSKIRSVDVYWTKANGGGYTNFGKARDLLFEDNLVYLYDSQANLLTVISPYNLLWMDIQR
jgi:hypothetical protein